MTKNQEPGTRSLDILKVAGVFVFKPYSVWIGRTSTKIYALRELESLEGQQIEAVTLWAAHLAVWLVSSTSSLSGLFCHMASFFSCSFFLFCRASSNIIWMVCWCPFKWDKKFVVECINKYEGWCNGYCVAAVGSRYVIAIWFIDFLDSVLLWRLFCKSLGAILIYASGNFHTGLGVLIN